MTDNNIVQLKTPLEDALEEIIKQGTQQLLAKAVEAERNDRTPVYLTVNSYIFEVLNHGCTMCINRTFRDLVKKS